MNENLSSAQWDVVRYTAPISYRTKKPSAREVLSSHNDYDAAWSTASKSNSRTNTAADAAHMYRAVLGLCTLFDTNGCL